MLKVDNINVYYGAIHAIKNVRYAHLDDLVRRCRLQIMILK